MSVAQAESAGSPVLFVRTGREWPTALLAPQAQDIP